MSAIKVHVNQSIALRNSLGNSLVENQSLAENQFLTGNQSLAESQINACNAKAHRIYHSKMKRFSDILIAAILLFVTAPLMGIAAFLIKLDGGPVFFGHSRVGYQHRTFRCWKFRTMVVDADAVLANLLKTDSAARETWSRDFKLTNDPRVTWVGRIMRVTSIDELPQLWNVLKGDMSIVGPRPVTIRELAMYDANVDDYLSCRPGITGLWQVSGRSKLSYDDRVSLDTHYVRSWTFFLDIKIVFKTVGVVLGRQGAC